MDYIRFSFDTKKLQLKESCIRIYPIVCWHLGAAQCDLPFIKEHISRIKADPNARWVYLGDGGECATKTSKGDVYLQTLGPQEQHDAIAKLLEPIKEKGLMGFQGNHGRRIDNESGLSFDKLLCVRLGIPYMGVSAIANLVVNRSSYDVFFHHGMDSGVSIQGKVTKAEAFGKFVNVDAMFTAHSHIAVELQPAASFSADNVGKKVQTRMTHQYICGSAYDSRSGYAEQKGYPPILPSQVVVQFDGRIIEGIPQKSQSSTIFRADGTPLEDKLAPKVKPRRKRGGR